MCWFSIDAHEGCMGHLGSDGVAETVSDMGYLVQVRRGGVLYVPMIKVRLAMRN
jgi:hypothetical protein